MVEVDVHGVSRRATEVLLGGMSETRPGLSTLDFLLGHTEGKRIGGFIMGLRGMRGFGALVGAGACAVTLVGCGSSDGSSDPARSSSSPSASASGQAGAPSNKGEASKPAKQVLADAKQALFAAKAVHIAGTESSPSGAGVKLDMQFQGEDSKGKVSLAGDLVGLVKTNGKVYINAPKTFWTKSAGAKAGPLAGKWIKVDAKQVPGVSGLTLQGIAASLNASDSPLEPKVATGSVEGKKAVILTQKDGSKLYVADDSPHVPLKILGSRKTPGTLLFTDYDHTKHISPPTGALTPQKALKGASTSAT